MYKGAIWGKQIGNPGPYVYDIVQTKNLQADTTLHNFVMGPTSRHMGTISLIVFWASLAYGVLAPMSEAVSAKTRRAYEALGVVVPPAWAIPLFLLVMLISQDASARLNSEHMEFIVSVICCAIIVGQIMSKGPTVAAKRQRRILTCIRERPATTFAGIVCLGLLMGSAIDVAWLSARQVAGRPAFPFALHYLEPAKNAPSIRDTNLLLEAIIQRKGDRVDLLVWQAENLTDAGEMEQAQALRARAESLAQNEIAMSNDDSYANYMASVAFEASDSRRASVFFNRAQALWQAELEDDDLSDSWRPSLVAAIIADRHGRFGDASSFLRQAIAIAREDNSQFTELLFEMRMAFPYSFVEDAIYTQRSRTAAG